MRKNIILLAMLATATAACTNSTAQPNQETPTVITKEVLLQDSICWNGEPLPAYPDGKPMCSVLKIVLPPHSKLAPHEHPMMNTAVVISGKLRVTDENGHTTVVQKGDVLLECVNRKHWGEVVSEEAVELIVFYAGNTTLPLSR